MSTGYAQADDDSGIDINSPIVLDNLSDQEDDFDVLEAASKVLFTIRKPSVRTVLQDNKASASDTNKWRLKKLNIGCVVEDGIGDEAKYKGAYVWPDLIMAFNSVDFPNDFSGDWWKKKARAPFAGLLAALGYDLAAPPAIDADFIASLDGRQVIADITKDQVEQVTDKPNPKRPGKFLYAPVEGKFQNDLKNFRSVE